MPQPIYYKPSPRYLCRKCKDVTPHYFRANGLMIVCLSCGDERPVKELVQATPMNQGGPEKRV